MTKDEFIKVLKNKTLNELEDWAWNWYKTASDRQSEIERLKKQKASETVKKTNKELREENKKLKGIIETISNKINPKTEEPKTEVRAEVANAD